MAERTRTRACVQSDTAHSLDVVQFVEGGEMAVDRAGVAERPQVLGGLQLGRIRRAYKEYPRR
jgi:hypothetical protein